jgi:hypothetical protein
VNCPNCGTSNLDTASICANCGRPLASAPSHSYTPPPPSQQAGSFSAPQPQPAGPGIPNYLIQSILVTLCCCQPLGIVAIIFAAMVNSRIAAGDLAGARDASSKAKLFFWIALGIALIGWATLWMTGGMAALRDIRAAMENH